MSSAPFSVTEYVVPSFGMIFVIVAFAISEMLGG
jgi:hypothetical protein